MSVSQTLKVLANTVYTNMLLLNLHNFKFFMVMKSHVNETKEASNT